MPRKISLGCKKVLADHSRPGLKACQNCLELMPSESETVNSQEDHVDVKQEFEETQEKVELMSPEVFTSAMEDVPKVTSCEICKFVGTESGMVVHMRDRHPNCPTCGFVASKPTLLKRHFKSKKHLFMIADLDLKTQKVEPISETNMSPRSSPKAHPQVLVSTNFSAKAYTCQECGKAFSTRDSLRAHKKHVHVRDVGPLDAECELCGAILTSNSYRDHLKKKHGITKIPKKSCFWCGQSMGVDKLKDHAKEHHFWGKFSCKACYFKGHFATDLAKHINLSHKGVVEAKCPQCEKGWSADDIEKHYRDMVARWL